MSVKSKATMYGKPIPQSDTENESSKPIQQGSWNRNVGSYAVPWNGTTVGRTQSTTQSTYLTPEDLSSSEYQAESNELNRTRNWGGQDPTLPVETLVNLPYAVNGKPVKSTPTTVTARRLHTGQYADRLKLLGLTNRDSIKAIQRKLGVEDDGVWGDITEGAYLKSNPQTPTITYTPVKGPSNENGIIPVRSGDNRMVEIGNPSESLGEVLRSSMKPVTTVSPQQYSLQSEFKLIGNNPKTGVPIYGGNFTRRQGRAMRNLGVNYINNAGQEINMGDMSLRDIRRLRRNQSILPLQSNLQKLKNGGMINYYQQGGAMNDEQIQQAFIQFLAQKSGAKNEKELQAYVKQLGEEGLQEAYAEFTQLLQLQQLQQVQAARHGAKLNYIRQLKHQCPEGQELVYFKQGGMVKCGCAGKKFEDGGKTSKKKQSAVEKFKNRKK